MNLFALSGLLTGITSFPVAVLVFLKRRGTLLNKIWILFTLCVAIWGFGCYKMASTADKTSAFLWYRLAHTGVILIPLFIYHFAFIFLDLKKRIVLKAVYFIGGIFFIANLLDIFNSYYFPDKAYYLIIAHMKWIFDSFYMDTPPGPIYPYFVLFFFSTIIIVYCELFKTLKKSTGVKRLQIKYFIAATLIGFVGGGTSFLPVFGINIYPIGNFTVVVSPLVITYAIINYRLMDIRVAITRAGIFIAVYALVLGVPFIMGYYLRNISGLWYIPLIVGMLLASAGPFIYTVIRRRAESRLRREEFLAHQALNKLAQNMVRFTKLETLLQLIAHHVVKIMKVNSASIYLRDQGNKHYQLRATWGINGTSPEQNEFLEDSSLIKDILLRRVPIVLEELSFGRTSKISSHLKRLQSELHRSKAAVIIPAFKGDYLFGFLMLGPRRDSRMFTQDDLNLLLLLANQSVLAIENAQLFEKEKILLAEKSRRDALADMAPGVAHQFNNRLAAIITSAEAQMALNELENITELNQEKLILLIRDSQNTLNIIEKEALRGKDIANAILKKGRAKLAYIKTDLVPIIQSAIDLLKVSRTTTSLEGAPEPEIVLDVEENLPQLILNESLAQDIFYNLIDNARDAIIIKYKSIKENKLAPDEIPFKGKITISIRKKGDEVIVTVSDNGIGMDEKTKARLFVPYFTTKATSLKGTGMGLWVIRSFIEDHKGRISFESEYTKGTTFTVTFTAGSNDHEEKTPDSR